MALPPRPLGVVFDPITVTDPMREPYGNFGPVRTGPGRDAQRWRLRLEPRSNLDRVPIGGDVVQSPNEAFAERGMDLRGRESGDNVDLRSDAELDKDVPANNGQDKDKDYRCGHEELTLAVSPV